MAMAAASVVYLFLIHLERKFLYGPATNSSSRLPKPSLTLVIKTTGLQEGRDSLPKLRCAGRISRDSTREIKSIGITTNGITLMNFPIVPLTKTSGRNAATVVRTENMTGRPTSMVPSIAASIYGLFICLCVYTFSPTIIASSTTIPSARMNANRESMLIEASRPGISSSAPRNDIGMPSITHMASLICRNSPRMINIRTRPMTAFLSSRLSLLRYMSE